MRAALFSLVLGGGCIGESATANAEASIEKLQTASATPVTYLAEATLDGSLAPIASVQLGFDVPGRIEKLLVSRGDIVTKGEALAQLDSAMARAQAAQAEAAVTSAEAQLAAGEAAWAKAQQMHQAGALSAQQFADAQAGILAGRAGVEQARAAQSLARAHLANHTLRAPIAGTISNGPDNAGMMIGGGTPIFLLEDLTSLQLKGTVAETETWPAAGMKAVVQLGIPGANETAEAVVTRVLPALDPTTRRLPIELRLISPPTAFRAHSYAKAMIQATEPSSALSIPRAAVVARPNLSVVVVRGETYVRVPVRVIREEGEKSLVTGEILPNEAVVVYPPSGLGGEG